jgi:hypothetical protein
MPAILSHDIAEGWLSSEIGLDELLRLPQVVGAQMEVRRVECYVKALGIDGPECIKPPPAIQFVPRTETKQGKTASFVKLMHSPRGFEVPSWGKIQRCASDSYKPLEGGRADGNRP